ncbi:MAG TPA: site-2 protease family protein [Pseudomonadales bacterium]|nr:site-2 protease family protein [Pseudomonadales bacterium]
MAEQHQLQSDGTGTTGPAGGLRIGALFGIEIRLDLSVLLIFALIVYSLANGVFPGWHPDWSAGLRWGTALAAGLLFFASLLAHEFSHSVVAQAYGIRVPRITLFLLGGVSELSAEPRTPRTEFLMAIAGPLMSLALGIVFSLIGMRVAGTQTAEALVEDQAAALAALSPLATMLLWLGPVNLMLAVFNMVPGFPLDGGRVLRALLWWLTGDQLRATRWASGTGRLFGWALMATGIFSVASGQGLGGLWLVLIGWFLSSAAQSSYTQLWLKQSLARLRVADLMRTHFETTTPRTPLTVFVDEQLLRGQQTLWPVLDGSGLVGWIRQADVARLSEADRMRLRVDDVMQTRESLETLTPDTPGDEAFGQLASAPEAPVAVLDGGEVVGLLGSADILRWLHLHQAR